LYFLHFFPLTEKVVPQNFLLVGPPHFFFVPQVLSLAVMFFLESRCPRPGERLLRRFVFDFFVSLLAAKTNLVPK